MRILFVLTNLLLWSVFALTASAQEPQISVEYDDEQTIVGQPAIVRIKVLVPTFLPQPPVWPSFEAPQLSVRLPERSTSPTSEQVDGATWAGITRTYRLYPMQEGTITVPEQEMIVTYADPDTNAEVRVTQKVPAIELVSVIPEGARGLDPLILANKVSASQTIEANENGLAVGDAIVRKIRVDIEGTSPLFIPTLLDEAVPKGVKPYEQDPKVAESLERGVLSGTRDEQTTYVAQSGGNVRLPDVVVEWYNLEANKIETITLEGQSFDIAEIEHETQIDTNKLKALLAVGLGITLVLWLMWRYLLPKINLGIGNLRRRYNGSRYFAYRQAMGAAKRRDLSDFLRGIDVLRARGGLRHKDQNTELEDAVLSLTKAIYDNRDQSDRNTEKQWQTASDALARRWSGSLWQQGRQGKSDLPSLNPMR